MKQSIIKTNNLWGENNRLRVKRIKPLLKMIKSYYGQYGNVSIVDIGGTQKYWDIISRDFLIKYKVKITCVNLLGQNRNIDDDIFTNVEGDGCNLFEFQNEHFNIAHSNSVIEHVGDWSNMVTFASEVKRVATSYFIQTPNYWFPIEPHRYLIFAHWLPKPIELWLLTHIKPLYKRVNGGKVQPNIDSAMRLIDESRMLSKKMFQFLFPEGYIITERICLLPKSFVAIKE
jgi:hypothetical protein